MTVRRRFGRAAVGPLSYELRHVLAGRYHGKNVSERTLLTHAVMEGASKSLCGLDEQVSLADAFATDSDDVLTCPRCIEKLARRQERAAKAGLVIRRADPRT